MEKIRNMISVDWSEVEKIYLEGIATKNATFEVSSPGWEKWDSNHLKKMRLVYEIDGKIVGWAALSPVSARNVYAGVAEISIYISEQYKGRGVGSKLMKTVIEESEKEGIWTIHSGVFPENTQSLALHHKFGFRTIGYREKIARLDGIWRDVLLLERRSRVTGL